MLTGLLRARGAAFGLRAEAADSRSRSPTLRSIDAKTFSFR